MVSSTITTLRKGSAASDKGRKRVDQILQSAVSLLISGGSEAFSMRGVAAETGISLGNLQYYFPKRKDLVWALLDQQRATVEEQIAKELAKSPRGRKPNAMLLRIIDYILDMNRKIENLAIDWNAWSMTLYDPEVRERVDAWYDNYFDVVNRLVREANPRMSRPRRDHIVRFIVFALEGESVVGRSMVRTRAEHAAHKRYFLRIVASIVSG